VCVSGRGGQRLGEESAGGRKIPLLRDQHVDDLPELIDWVVQVDPPFSDLELSLIFEPAIHQNVSAWSGGVNQQWSKALHPAVDRDVPTAIVPWCECGTLAVDLRDSVVILIR
jgi:hypothetical protein